MIDFNIIYKTGTLDTFKMTKVKLTLKGNRELFLEVENHNELLRDIEQCRHRNQFFKYNKIYIAASEIDTIEIDSETYIKEQEKIKSNWKS